MWLIFSIMVYHLDQIYSNFSIITKGTPIHIIISLYGQSLTLSHFKAFPTHNYQPLTEIFIK